MRPAPAASRDARTGAGPSGPPALRPVRRRTRSGLGARVLALCLWAFAAASSPCVLRAAGDADTPHDAPGTPPTPSERAAYWLERLLRGPDGPSLGIPHYHQNLLVDAQQGLVDVPEAALALLADEGLRERVTTARDTNAWHAILGLLIKIGADRPAVARAWAAAGLQHEEISLRRLSAAVFSALRAPEDLTQLLEALRRDASDRLIGPALVKTLVGFGPGAAGAAARLAYERLPVDGGEGSSVWNGLPELLERAQGGPFDDVLAWWALLTDGSGPRAPDPATVRGSALPRIDPDRMEALALAHFLTDGRRATAEAHALLALRGRPTAKAAVEAGLASGDPLVRTSCEEVVATLRRRAHTDRAEVRTRAGALLNALPALERAGPAAVVDLIVALRADETPEARALLLRLFAALPPVPAWKGALEAAHDAVLVGGGDPTPTLDALLRSTKPVEPGIALSLIRRSRDPRYVDVLERFAADPASAPLRPRLRREIAFLVVANLEGRARIPPDRLADFAARVRGWIEDPGDPSAGGFVGTLLDMGPAGQAELAAGLTGPRRSVFVEALGGEPQGRLDAAAMATLVAPLDATTPPNERATVLRAVYFTARGSAVPALLDLRRRLNPEARGEVDALLRMIRHRAP